MDKRLFSTLDETLGLSAFSEEVLATAHSMIKDPVLKRLVRRDLAAVRIFSAKVSACLTDMIAASRETPPPRISEPSGTTCLPMRQLEDDVGLATWCSGSENALEHCIDIAIAQRASVDIERMLRRQLSRILMRRARLEDWIASHPSTVAPQLQPHMLLIKLSAVSGEHQLVLRNIPCLPGEAERIVRHNPLMVLVNPTKAAEQTTLNVAEAMSVITDSAARFARGRTN